MIKPKVLFLCTGNSRRTQMAEGFLRAMAGDRFDAISAGSEETPIDPDAIAVMREVGVDISGQETKAVNRFLGRRFNYVVSLCDREKERTCPIFRAQSGVCNGILRTLRKLSREKIAGRRCAVCAMTFNSAWWRSWKSTRKERWQ